MHIRPETPSDYSAVAAVHVRAFDERLAEAQIVALQRQRQAYDPELSLVAEVGRRIVGHALFTGATIRLDGKSVRAVNLAPIAIDPAFQRQGYGAALMDEGHRIAQAKGYALSFLLGHVDYYPRFGYIGSVFGSASIETSIDLLSGAGLPDATMETRNITEADLPALRALWLHEERDVDFATEPEETLVDWLSPNPAITASVYLRDNRIVGYTRIDARKPSSPPTFMAVDHDAARLMAAEIGRTAKMISLPLHPYSASAPAFGAPDFGVWNAGMACPLMSGVLDSLLAQYKAGTRLRGRPIWATAFDVS